jgi:hypothetical protein
MAGRLLPPGFQMLDGNGRPLAGALANWYEAGTSTPANTYSDADLSVANANPVVADADGRFGPIFAPTAEFRLVMQTAAGVTVFTADPVQPVGDSATEASEAEVDAREAEDVYVSPRRLAEGLGVQGASIAAAAELELPAIGDYFNVTGSAATITSISERAAGRVVELVFASANTIEHDATALILPSGADIETYAGLVLRFRSEGSSNWRLVGPGGVKPSFSAHKNGTDQTGIASATDTKITFGTEEWDDGGYYDAANSKFLPLEPGQYQIVASVEATANIVDQNSYWTRLYKNGTEYRDGPKARGSGTGSVTATINMIVDFNGSTDFVEVYFIGGGAGNKTVEGDSKLTYFQAFKL